MQRLGVGGNGFNLLTQDIFEERIPCAEDAERDYTVRAECHILQRPPDDAVAAERK